MPRRHKVADTAHAKEMAVLRANPRFKLESFCKSPDDIEKIKGQLEHWKAAGHKLSVPALYPQDKNILYFQCSSCHWMLYFCYGNYYDSDRLHIHIPHWHYSKPDEIYGWEWDPHYGNNITCCALYRSKGVSANDPILAPKPF